jgi:hypothetical protein
MSHIRTSEEFLKVRVEGADDRFVNRYPDIFDAEDWEVVLDIMLHRFENLKELSGKRKSLREYTQKIMTSRPHLKTKVHKGNLVDFDLIDSIFEKLYIALFGSISTGRDTASPAARKKRKAPAEAKSKIDWKNGPLGKLMEAVVLCMGLNCKTDDYAAMFVAMVQTLYGPRMTVNPKALEVEIHRQKRALETAIKTGTKVLTPEQIREQLTGLSDEDLPFLTVESEWREGGGV